MTITDTMHKMLDEVTDEEKKELRAKIEQQAGSPYHRTLLAMLRDLERENEKLDGIVGEERAARQSETNRADASERKAVALNKERHRVHDVVSAWLESYAKEVSRRGQDEGSPRAVTEAARAALVVRETARQFAKAFPVSPLVLGTLIHEQAEQLAKLLHCMGDLTLEEASRQIQQHSPWNGKDRCNIQRSEDGKRPNEATSPSPEDGKR
jgi:hypothetical protein